MLFSNLLLLGSIILLFLPLHLVNKTLVFLSTILLHSFFLSYFYQQNHILLSISMLILLQSPMKTHQSLIFPQFVGNKYTAHTITIHPLQFFLLYSHQQNPLTQSTLMQSFLLQLQDLLAIGLALHQDIAQMALYSHQQIDIQSRHLDSIYLNNYITIYLHLSVLIVRLAILKPKDGICYLTKRFRRQNHLKNNYHYLNFNRLFSGSDSLMILTNIVLWSNFQSCEEFLSLTNTAFLYFNYKSLSTVALGPQLMGLSSSKPLRLISLSFSKHNNSLL